MLTLVRRHRTNMFQRQRGVVLVATLFMITVLAILAITLAIVPVGDLKVSNNNKDQLFAQQTSLDALEEAKKWVMQNWNNNAALPLLACSYPTAVRLQNATFAVDSYSNNPFSWWQSNGCAANTNPSGAAESPYYIIKYLGCDNPDAVDLYQIIARGTGVSANTVAYSEAIIAVPPRSDITGVNSGTPDAVLVTATRPGATIPEQGTYGWYFYGPWQGWMQRSSTIGLFQGGWMWGSINWTGWCPQGVGVWSFCTRNCAGLLRVSGYSGNDNPPCELKVGPWVDMGGTSSIQVRDGDGILRTFSCSQ